MAQNPSRLEENVKQLNWEKGALVLLKDQVERRGERGKQVWLQNVEGKIQEINELTKEAAELKKGNNSNSWSARVGLNNRVIQLLKDVNVLKERGNAKSESVERLLNEVVTNKPKKFSSGDLKSFTSNFSIKIGTGAFGRIYEGQFPNGVKVAVKVLSEKNFTVEIFTSEVSTIGKISHRCLVKLYGFCFEDGMKALVYEYMSNGSLDKILHGKGLGIDWDKLYGIAIETAKGLSYLHDGCHVQIIHHHVKPSNILLDSNHVPKISDFGLAKLMNQDVSHRTNSRMRGTPGYIAPEIWIPSSRITPKCDVYSFGVLLFEILKMGYGDHSIKWFLKQVWEKFRVGQLDEIIKECGITESSRENAKTLAMVALWCVQYTPQIRPTMSTVVMLLEKKIQVTSPPNPFVPSLESSVPLGEQRFPKNESEPNIEKSATSQGSQSCNASSSNSILELFEKKKPVVEDQWKLVFPLNYLFPPDYEFYKNDAEQLWCLFGGGTPIELLHDHLLQFSRIDNATGMPMYKLKNMPKDHYDNDYLSMYQYLIIHDVGSCIPKTTMHISVCGSIDSNFFETLYEIEALKTLLILRGDGPRLDRLPYNLFRKLPYLQALDLSHTDIIELPSSIRFSQQLRHLNLSYTSIVELPNSVCNILTLETLNLRGCFKLRSLPKGIRRLTSLKHLDVDVSCLLVSMPPGVGDLCQLQTLPAFVIGKQHGWHINELKNLKYLRHNLRVLRLENLSSPEQAKEVSLHSKHHLQKLEFHWSRPEDGFEVLEGLRPGQYIQELQIVGYGGAKFPSWIEEPSFFRLTTITIHNCSKSDTLPSLGKLRSLKFLHISDMDEVKVIDQQFSGNSIIDHENTVEAFAMLEQLTFIGMPELNQWIGVGEGDFPRLQKLKISHCPKLKILPKLSLFSSLQQLHISLGHSLESFPDGEFPISLQSIVIVECPKLKERYHKDMGENWEKLAHITDIWIDHQKISLVEETPEVRNLGTSKNATGDMIPVHSNFDNCPSPISSLLGDGDDRRQTEVQFEAAEKIVLQWASRTSTPERHSLLWEESPEEAAEYLFAVDEILQLTEDLTLSHLVEGDITNRAKNVLQLAMLRLGDDFRHILIRNTVPLDAGRLHGWIRGVSLPFASSDGDTDYFWSSVDGDNDDDDDGDNSSSVSWYHDSGLSLGDDVLVDLIDHDAVVDLKEIAERMIRSGYEKECCQVYSSVRRDVLDECLSILGIDKLSIEEAQMVGWINMAEKMKKWIEAVKIVVRRLSGEKYLCDQIFQRSELIKGVCFTETAKGCVIQLLNFGKAVAIGRRSPEKLFRTLDMYETLRDALPKLLELFSDDSSNFVRSEGNTLLQGLEEAAKDTFADFENKLQSETSWKPIQGGEIHPVTRYVMNYVKFLVEYSDTLNLLLQSSSSSPDHVEGNDDDILHSRIDSPLGRRVLLLLSSVESNLEEKSKHYKDGAMRYIFLINNIHYIVQKVKNSDIGKLLGDHWTRKRSGQVRQYATGYLRASWSKALSCLKDEGIGGSGSSSNVSKATLKERFNSFNLCFEAVCGTQRQWKVSDPQLREELQISISQTVLPAYRSFLGRFGSQIESGRHAGKYIRYRPEDLEIHLLNLFEGTSGILHKD